MQHFLLQAACVPGAFPARRGFAHDANQVYSES